MNDLDFMYKGIPLLAVIIALSKTLTLVGFDKKFIPIANILLGMFGGTLYLYPSDVKMGVLVGLVLGLTATGTYSSFKNVKEGISE